MIFGDFDVSEFWRDCECSDYMEEFPSDETIASVESSLRYKIPSAYVELSRTQNGGVPNNTGCATTTSTSWAENHVAISGIFAIGKSACYSLAGPMGTQFWIDEWRYPGIGIYFADCPSAGHDMVALDYRDCGPGGEPCVVHVDQECGYRITKIADTFEAFIRSLRPSEEFET